jgi:pimeloyl-ACP methyl ester carboxylesterase
MPPTFQLILLPGLGADHRLLEPQRAAFPQLVIPPWIPPRKNESLPQYAARMAEIVAPSRDAPLILGGVSFGGMLAYEMARHLKPDAVVLIASCRTRKSLRPIYAPGRWLPVTAWSLAKLFSGPVIRFRHRRSAAKRELLTAMFKESDSAFMRWTLRAILSWQSTPPADVPIYQIHGRRDRVIPASKVDADAWIPNGGHLINVTHADQVNAFIRNALDL